MAAFEKLSVYLERNVQDHDAEIRFEADRRARMGWLR